jgi:ParB/RepB/Spo0J family partition protein
MSESSFASASRSFVDVAVDMVDLPEKLLRRQVDEEALERLRRSIASHGVLVPLVMVAAGERFRLVAGLRRYLCARAIGLATVPALVVKERGSWERWAMWAENDERENVNAVDEGVWMAEQIEESGIGQKELAAMLGVSESFVSQRLSVLAWPADVVEAVAMSVVSWSVGRELSQITDSRTRAYCLDVARRCGCSVRQAAMWRQNWQKGVNGSSSGRGSGAAGAVRESSRGVAVCVVCREEDADGGGLIQYVCERCLAALESARSDSVGQKSPKQ